MHRGETFHCEKQRHTGGLGYEYHRMKREPSYWLPSYLYSRMEPCHCKAVRETNFNSDQAKKKFF